MLAQNALTTLDTVKLFLDIDLADTSNDALLEQLINIVSAEISRECRLDFNIATNPEGYVLPKDETPTNPRTLPYDVEGACTEIVVTRYNMRGSEHLKTEVVGPLRSDFLSGLSAHVRETLLFYKVVSL